MNNLGSSIFSLKGIRVYVAGHTGMVGSALIRRLKIMDCKILRVDSLDLDLKDYVAVNKWFKENKPDVVFMAAAKVGGIHANNTYPVEFLYENIAIQNNWKNYKNRVHKRRATFSKKL